MALTRALFCVALSFALPGFAKTPQVVAEAANVIELSQALAPPLVAKLLAGAGSGLSDSDRRALAALVAVGAVSPADLSIQNLNQVLARAERALTHPAFLGTTGELGLVDRLAEPLSYERLLLDAPLLALLNQALTAGTLTGYDLRVKGVYDSFPAGGTFIYSHSSPAHLQQLVSLMAAHHVVANVYLTPKVSAFLFREGWGETGTGPDALANGTRVVNGRESATLFEFRSAQDKANFHDLIERYAKRDSEEEAGLIKDAWWQPFYYADQVFADFQPISLVVLTSQQLEATLTVRQDNTDKVVQALSGRGYELRVDQVWVNPAFYRFLLGDYR